MKTIWQKLDESCPYNKEFSETKYPENVICRCLLEMRERESETLQFRFGLNGCKFHTLKQCAKTYGVSSENIRQREAKGLRQLRRLLRNIQTKEEE